MLKPACAAFLSSPCHFTAVISVFYPSLQGSKESCSFFSLLVTGSPQRGVALKRIIEINCLINYQRNQVLCSSVARSCPNKGSRKMLSRSGFTAGRLGLGQQSSRTTQGFHMNVQLFFET